MTDQSDTHDKTLRVAWWTLAVIVFGFVLAIRIRLLGIPLERDEGEYAYAGQLMLQGIPPYKLAYNMKFPGTYAAYAAIMSIFGQTIFAIHLGLLLVNAITIALDFLTGATADEFDRRNRRSNDLRRPLCKPIRPRVSCSRHEFCDDSRAWRDTAPAQHNRSTGA